MTRILLLTLSLALCTASFASAQSGPLGTIRPAQPKGFGGTPRPTLLAGGDTFGTATVIAALPYSDTGNTCGYADDYTPPCAYSYAPDVVYAYTPSSDMCVSISLCGSQFDTAIHVYRNDDTTLVACQDDSYECGLASHLASVPLTAGDTYYIVIDGYGVACGEYALSVTRCPTPQPCEPCPASAIQEGEPNSSGLVDTYNGGCNLSPPLFTRLTCASPLVVCGTYGTFDNNNMRDTDWYELVIPTPTTLTASVQGGGRTGSALAILDANCPPGVLCGQFAPSAECATVTCSAVVAPGTYHIFVASLWDGTPHETPYVLTVEGLDCPTPVRTRTWGALKTLYR